MELQKSVGLKGANLKPDVELVQESLNRSISVPYALLKVDGLIGPQTNAAIKRFQRFHLKFRYPDSLVNKGGKTWRALSVFLVEPKETATQRSASFSISNYSMSPAEKAAKPTSKSFIPCRTETSCTIKVKKIAWGAKVSPQFKTKVMEICKELGVNADFLMACMAFETGETFSPSIKNAAGSGATGLIQFMPTTAKSLGTTTDALAKMTAVEQLEYVKKYFKPYSSRLKKLEDVYMAILYPAAIGKPAEHALFKQGRKTYSQNKGFDKNKDGKITLSEISSKVRAKYDLGLKQGYLG